MAETMMSIIEDETSRFTALDQGRLARGGLYQNLRNRVNEPGKRGLISLPGEGTFEAEHWQVPLVEAENLEQVHALVRGVVQEIADRAMIG